MQLGSEHASWLGGLIILEKDKHPNLSKITFRPWGAKEFALRDKQLGIVIQQW